MERIYLFFKKLFTFSYSEARGFAWLLIISLILLFFIFFPKFFFNRERQVDQSDVKLLDSLTALLENRQQHKTFLFNPNKISKDSLLLLGFTEEITERLMNYRSKGGSFKVKGDLKKIYGIDSQLIDSIYAFIDLPDSIILGNKRKKLASFDINQASLEDLMQVYMIGEVLAARIIKYRTVLGGFIAEDQFDEIYGISDIALKNLKSSTFIDMKFRPRLIKVNHASLDELKQHPYISDQLAEDIVRYREINLTIDSEKVLVNFKSVDKSKFQKLIFYLEFQ